MTRRTVKVVTGAVEETKVKTVNPKALDKESYMDEKTKSRERQMTRIVDGSFRMSRLRPVPNFDARPAMSKYEVWLNTVVPKIRADSSIRTDVPRSKLAPVSLDTLKQIMRIASAEPKNVIDTSTFLQYATYAQMNNIPNFYSDEAIISDYADLDIPKFQSKFYTDQSASMNIIDVDYDYKPDEIKAQILRFGYIASTSSNKYQSRILLLSHDRIRNLFEWIGKPVLIAFIQAKDPGADIKEVLRDLDNIYKDPDAEIRKTNELLAKILVSSRPSITPASVLAKVQDASFLPSADTETAVRTKLDPNLVDSFRLQRNAEEEQRDLALIQAEEQLNADIAREYQRIQPMRDKITDLKNDIERLKVDLQTHETTFRAKVNPKATAVKAYEKKKTTLSDDLKKAERDLPVAITDYENAIIRIKQQEDNERRRFRQDIDRVFQKSVSDLRADIERKRANIETGVNVDQSIRARQIQTASDDIAAFDKALMNAPIPATSSMPVPVPVPVTPGKAPAPVTPVKPQTNAWSAPPTTPVLKQPPQPPQNENDFPLLMLEDEDPQVRSPDKRTAVIGDFVNVRTKDSTGQIVIQLGVVKAPKTTKSEMNITFENGERKVLTEFIKKVKFFPANYQIPGKTLIPVKLGEIPMVFHNKVLGSSADIKAAYQKFMKANTSSSPAATTPASKGFTSQMLNLTTFEKIMTDNLTMKNVYLISFN